MSDSLYKQDFFRWTEQQADALRTLAESGTNLPLDWENLAEEIESLGRSNRRELSSRMGTIIEHLLKLEFSRAVRPRRGWQQTIRRERLEVERLLEGSPSLRQHIPELVVQESRRALKLVSHELAEVRPGLDGLSDRRYTEREILGDWFPGSR